MCSSHKIDRCTKFYCCGITFIPCPCSCQEQAVCSLFVFITRLLNIIFFIVMTVQSVWKWASVIKWFFSQIWVGPLDASRAADCCSRRLSQYGFNVWHNQKQANKQTITQRRTSSHTHTRVQEHTKCQRSQCDTCRTWAILHLLCYSSHSLFFEILPWQRVVAGLVMLKEERKKKYTYRFFRRQ